MADFVQVVVQVDKSQLASLQADINKIKGVTIPVKTDTNGIHNTTTAVKQLGDAAETAAKKSESLFDNVQKFTRWYLIGNAVSAVVGSLRDALSTMKAVDDELVTVRKVSGFTAEEMKRVEDQAYKTASAYGIAADAYLQFVSGFTRAGYREQSAALAELAAKTQIVGDTSADVAQQFLLSVDAAYKYNGEISKLSAVLDGANEIDNKYATSIAKVAEGLGIVAPVAAQLGVGIDELTAMLGTITAVTQRSGSEAARALRSVLINLTSDVNATFTDINGEITYAIGEIDGLSDVVQLYAKDLYDSAKATGKILNPTEVLEALVRASEEGRLTEQKLYDLVTDESGKLRAAQLWALIQNWDTMYKSMLTDYAGAVGSADREVENAMDSWSRKTAQLSNEWTEFISHLIKTDEIKAGLDVLIGAVNFLDSGFGKFVITIGLFTVAFNLASAAVAKFAGTELAATIATFKYLTAVVGLGEAAKATAASLLEMAMASPTFLVTAGAAAIYGTIKALDWMTDTYEEQREKLAELEEQYKRTYGEGSEIDQLRSKVGELTEEEKARLVELELEEQKLKEQLETEQRITFEKWRRSQFEDSGPTRGDDGFITFYSNRTESDLASAQQAFEKLNGEFANTKDVTAYKQGLQGVLSSLKDSKEAIEDGLAVGEELSDSEQGILDLYNQIVGILGDYVDSTYAAADAQNNAAETGNEEGSALEGLIGKLDDLSGKLSVVKNAFEDFNDDGRLTFDTLSDIRDKFAELGDEAIDGYIDRLVDANLTSEEFSSIMSDMTLALAETKIGTENLTESNRDYIERMLEGIGVQNASETATYLIAKAQETAKAATDRDTEAVEDYNDTPVESSQKVGASNDITGAEVVQKQATDNAKGAIQGFNAQGVDSSSKVGAFNNITAAAAGLQAQIYNTHLQLNSFFNAAAKLGTKLGTQVETKLDNKAKWDARREGAVLSATAAKAEWFNGSGNFSGVNFDFPGTGTSGKTGGSPSGTGATGSETDTYLESLKQAVSDEKARYELMEAQGAAAAALNAQAENVQAALHAQAEYMRSIRASYSDVASLSKDWFSWEEKKSKNLEEERKARIQEYADAKEARENELAFLEASGADYDERIAKNREIQTALHNQAEYLRQIGASEEEILSLSTEWWKVEKEINDLEEERLKKKTEEYADDVDAYKNQLDFLEASGASEQMRIAKMRQIQDALHVQAEYMRSIGASEEDIRKLSTEWWNIENDILDLQDEIAQKLRDEIAKVMEDITEALTRQKEAILEPLNKELDSLKEAHELTENRREEEEKILAVEKARIALQNAQNERTVRQYNAATGQWEWVANAQTVEKARQSLIDAETALSEYYAQKEYEAAVNNLEKQIDYTDLAFKAFQDAWEEATEAVRDGKMSFQEAYAYIKRKMKEIYDEYGVDLSATLEEAGATLLDSMDSFSKFIEVALQTDNPADAIKELGDAIRAGVIDNINDIGTILRALNGEYDGISYQTAKILALTQMQANSIAWHMTDDQATRDALHSENEALGRSIGLQYDAASGTWTDASGNAVYTLSNIGGSWTSALNTAILSIADFINNATARAVPEMAAGGSASGSSGGGSSSIVSSKTTGNLTTTQYKDGSRTTSTATGFTRSTSPTGATRTYFGVTQNEAKSKYENGKKYDAGGILRGLGGIKATEADEMILPPEMTSGLLKAEQNGAFDSLLRHLGIVTAAANNYSLFGSPTARSSIGSQHNGNVYQFGDVMLSEQQARGTSVYDLAQMAGTLPLHSA